MEAILNRLECEPYREAKEYIERMRMEQGLQKTRDGQPSEEHQETEQDIQNESSLSSCETRGETERAECLHSLPIAVPCSPLSYATVEWDVPEIMRAPLDPDAEVFKLSHSELQLIPQQPPPHMCAESTEPLTSPADITGGAHYVAEMSESRTEALENSQSQWKMGNGPGVLIQEDTDAEKSQSDTKPQEQPHSNHTPENQDFDSCPFLIEEVTSHVFIPKPWYNDPAGHSEEPAETQPQHLEYSALERPTNIEEPKCVLSQTEDETIVRCSDEEQSRHSEAQKKPASDPSEEISEGPTPLAVPTEDVKATDMNSVGVKVDRAKALSLAERLYRLDGFQRTDVVRHLYKDTEFSRIVGEEYLKFFNFTDQSLEQALRSFLKEVVLIGETQERERVLQRFSSRFLQCNPETFSSAGSVLTLTCAMMLLNTDLHGQNVGKPMSSTEFVSNLEQVDGGDCFDKDSLKTLYSSIKSERLPWAIEEELLAKCLAEEQDPDRDVLLRSKTNPFQDLPHDRKAAIFHKGFLKRKAHADIDGKRTPWGKRRWKTFYAVLKGMVLYLQKDQYRLDWQSSEEALSVHHTLAEPALNYTKRPHVFRLQTADWRIFLFEAPSTEQMNSWIGRINLVSALHSSPPFPAAVGSQRRFSRPILPATQSTLTPDQQLLSHAAVLQSFQQEAASLQQEAPERQRSRGRELEELRMREEYSQYEKSRYEVYLKTLDAWKTTEKPGVSVGERLQAIDTALWRDAMMEEEEDDDAGMKRSHSSPSLELETPQQPVVKVRRNISERRTYRKIVIPRRNKEL